MLVEEPVQHDHVCLVPGRVKPFILIIFRCRISLSQRILVYGTCGRGNAYVDLAQESSDVDDVGGKEVVEGNHMHFLAEEYVVR